MQATLTTDALIEGAWLKPGAHVDGVGAVLDIASDARSVRMRFGCPAPLARYFARKGSVAIDGTSLTVNEVEGNCFGVNIIPHTASVTGFGTLAPGVYQVGDT